MDGHQSVAVAAASQGGEKTPLTVSSVAWRRYLRAVAAHAPHAMLRTTAPTCGCVVGGATAAPRVGDGCRRGAVRSSTQRHDESPSTGTRGGAHRRVVVEREDAQPGSGGDEPGIAHRAHGPLGVVGGRAAARAAVQPRRVARARDGGRERLATPRGCTGARDALLLWLRRHRLRRRSDLCIHFRSDNAPHERAEDEELTAARPGAGVHAC